MTHTRIHHRALAILAIAVATVFALSATTASPASARTFYFNSAGTMVQQPLPTEWSCVLQRALSGQPQSMHCRVASNAAQSSSRRFGLNANSSVPAPPTSRMATSQPTTPSPPTIVRVTAPSGFAWGDAGIGAAGGLALAMIGLGGVLVIFQARARHSAT